MPKVLHASHSGYFPACLTEDPDLADNFLKTAMAMYWKVRTLSITIFAYGNTTPVTFTSTAPDESWLVCNNIGQEGPNNKAGFLQLLPNGTIVPYNVENNFFLDGFYVDSYSKPTAYGVNPRFRVRITTGEFSYADFASVGMGDGEQFVGYYDFPFSGGEALYELLEDEEAPPAGGLITVDEYWSYDGTFDTKTGEPL